MWGHYFIFWKILKGWKEAQIFYVYEWRIALKSHIRGLDHWKMKWFECITSWRVVCTRKWSSSVTTGALNTKTEASTDFPWNKKRRVYSKVFNSCKLSNRYVDLTRKSVSTYSWFTNLSNAYSQHLFCRIGAVGVSWVYPSPSSEVIYYKLYK